MSEGPKVRKTLTKALRRARVIAVEAKHARVSEVHLMAALLRDTEVRDAIRYVGADLEEVKDLVEGTLLEERKRPWYYFGRTGESEGLGATLDRAMVRALSSELTWIDPLLVLTTILDSPASSNLIERLDAFGVEALPIKFFAAHGAVPDHIAEAEADAKTVLTMHNDPFTTKEFVVSALCDQLDRSEQEAVELMERVHTRGSAPLEEGPYHETRPMADKVRDAARRQGFPLRLELSIER